MWRKTQNQAPLPIRYRSPLKNPLIAFCSKGYIIKIRLYYKELIVF